MIVVGFHFRFRLWNMYRQYTILRFGLDGVFLDGIGQCEATRKVTVVSFHLMELLVLLLFLLSTLTAQRQESVLIGNFHVLLLYRRQRRPNQVLLIGLADVHRRPPV